MSGFKIEQGNQKHNYRVVFEMTGSKLKSDQEGAHAALNNESGLAGTHVANLNQDEEL